MDRIRRSPDADEEDARILLVGPDSWQERIRPRIGTTDGVSVRAVGRFERAVEVLEARSDATDCVVAAHRLDGGTGLELLGEIRALDVTTPFVLAPEAGDESLASEAFAAGVADYVPVGDDGDDESVSDGDDKNDGARLADRCLRAVRDHRDDRRHRERAAQFDACFGDPERFVAVLDADGTVVRANRVALDALRLDETAVLGKRFWGLPWAAVGESRRDLQRAVRSATDGEYATFEAGLASGDRERRFEFSVRPVGETGRVVVEGHEVAERVRLEEELRESEELHRVTLNNMTDTVLVTDDDGAFTYVCPNVHFIFGYTVEEIYEFGTIDALLGDDLFDRDRLESETVLTNVECTATDKTGREHALLVNVRNVSIQGGTTLYSCRDITKRKQRERALTQLHRTSRDLLYAETAAEIADRVVADAASILPTAATAVYRFDREENELIPTAASDAFDAATESHSAVGLDDSSAIARAFVADETLTRDVVTPETGTPDDRPELRDSPLALADDYVAVPLGDHGVFVAVAGGDRGAPDAPRSHDGAFDEVSEEVAELLSATTEAALDRVERETELRERDSALQRQNRKLSQLNQVNGFIREIDQALVRAETRDEIERAVCDRLTTDDRFAFAWVGETTASGTTLRPRAWAGDEQGYLDGVPLELDADAASVEPSVEAAADREAALVSNVADHLRAGPWCAEAVSRDFQSVLAIPLAYDDVLFGTLTVYANRPDAFDDMVRSVLCELGDTVASAINAVQRKEALRSDTVVQLDYRISDRSTVLRRLADETGATIRVEGDVTHDDGTTLVFATVEDAPLDRVVEAADGFVGVTDAEPIRETDESDGLVGLRVRDHFVTRILADHGAMLRRLQATPEGISLTVDVPDSVTARSIDEVVSNAYDGAELVAQREQVRTLETNDARGRFRDDLTERQLEVAQVAYHSGFFDAQRDVTGRDVAAMLDISHTAFYDHVRRIERKLLASVFESAPTPTTSTKVE
ncbi:bacterio-opsin activator domain-containing protein [Halorussus amylolyticus]|uniref:bacterio-opsin activator domain-containing protein n=1 Tax=Halorussus amylolyticus TaxID=1126242 RepID=UPI00104B51FD|nr:bacterio-opsin activator domain-containing protein [Halorussus amylolyticus]